MTCPQETQPQASPSTGASWFLTTVFCLAVPLEGMGSSSSNVQVVGGALAARIGDRVAQPVREAGPC